MLGDSPYTRLSQRLPQLPLVLAGPILRRTEPASVTVWLALQQPCEVCLWVFAVMDDGETVGEVMLEGCQPTIAVGEHLHLVAVTASGERSLQPGCLYAYDLSFDPLPHESSKGWEKRVGGGVRVTLRQGLISDSFPKASVSYFAHQLPTFSLPPKDISNLQLVHGSCRKPHGKGSDTMPIVDELIQHTASQPNNRPHQLFLTGDQIYGDDVADALLYELTDAGDALLGWEEKLPVALSSQGVVTSEYSPSQFLPGERSETAEALAGFTAGLHHKASHAKSHLLSLGEYCAVYLFLWSPVLWSRLSTSADRKLSKKAAQRWDTEVGELQRLAQTLSKVRRALANVPTYMIFDDHDVSDDWNLNQAWCLRVLGKPLGRRAVQNALTTYALFQAWGNTPAQFVAGSGALLLEAIAQWSDSAGTNLDAKDAITRYLGLPPTDVLTGLPQLRSEENVFVLDSAADALTWHYTLQSACHEVIVLDTRTQRGYPMHEPPTAPAMLLSPSAFDRQIRQPMQQFAESTRMTILIAPTNLVSMQAIDWIQAWNLKQNNVYSNDVGDAWNIHRAAFARLLKTLFEESQQIVVLSGDIHYGSAVRLDYWDAARQCVLAQLTSSALKNSEIKTELVHTRLKATILPERDRHWIGWDNPLREHEIRSSAVPLSLKADNLASLSETDRPNWRYRIQWIPRQTAQTPPWGRNAGWIPRFPVYRSQWLHRLIRWLMKPWRDRWLQEGGEVVGRDNVGLVQFDPQQNAVQQSLYWYAPWKPNTIVSSRFHVPLWPSDR
jgi:hypothetical protein